MTIRDADIELMIQALVDGELDDTAARDVEARIAADPALAAQRDSLITLKAAIKRMPQPPVSDTFKAKISAIASVHGQMAAKPLQKSRSFWPIFSRSYGWQAVAASIVITAVLSGSIMRLAMLGAAPDSFTLAIADDHRRSLLAASPFDVASSDRHTVKPYLDAKLGLSPPAPDLAAQGFALAGGRVEVVAERPVPVLIYRHHEHLISLVAIPNQNTAKSEPVDLPYGGFSMVKWSDGAFSYWAISDTEWTDLNIFVGQFRAATAPN